MTYGGKLSYVPIKSIDKKAEKDLEELLFWLKEKGLNFYRMAEVKQGVQRYVEVTVSIKLS